MDKQSASTRSDRWWDLPAVILLLVVLTAGFTRLIATQWTEGLTITRTLSYLGLAAGLALGYSIFPPRLAALFATVYGLFAVPWRLGLMLGEGILWQERVTSLGGRLSTTVYQLFHQQAVTDNLLFLTLMSALFWFLSVYAGYSLTRYASPWRTVLPTGLAMVVIHSYDAYLSIRSWYLVLYLLFALLLVARLVFLHRRQRWEQTHTYMPPQLGLDFIRVALAASVVLLLLAWTVPALADSLPAARDAWRQIKRPWDEVKDNFDNAFASLRSSVGVVNDYYGSSLSLGRGNRLSDNVVFTVQTPPDPPEGVRFYWRARVFDVYQSGGWNSTLTTARTVQPDENSLAFPVEAERGPGQYSFTFNMQAAIATLFTVPQPQWVSRPARAELAINPDGTVDLGSLRATPVLQAGDTYTARASLSNVTITQMRQSSGEYPAWLAERYLELPPEVTERTRRLAAEITAGAETPYDKVAAINAYLRENIVYSETLPALPSDQELVDWFLFDLKQGFCNYYASAEVVLLRAVGIPARIAVGYAQGEYDEVTGVYTVRQRDAHAWPEVYFSGLGWVEFEPTAGQPEIVRLLGDQAGSDASSATPEALTPERRDPLTQPLDPGAGASAGAVDPRQRVIQIAIAAGLVALLALIVIPMGWKRRLFEKLPPLPVLLESGLRRAGLQPPNALRLWVQRVSLSPLARAYQEINQALGRLGKPPQAANTPAERAAALAQELPAAGQPVERLLAEYQTATYAGQGADVAAARLAGAEIRSLSLRAFFQRLVRGRQQPPEDRFRR